MPIDTTNPIRMHINVVVLIEEWLHGKEAFETGAYLRSTKTRKLDIIGHIIRARLGTGSDYILDDKRFVSDIAEVIAMSRRTADPPLDFLLTPSHQDTEEAYALMQFNDRPDLEMEDRQLQIANLLKKYRIGVKFTSKADAKKVNENQSTLNFAVSANEFAQILNRAPRRNLDDL